MIELLTFEQAAEQLGCSLTTVKRRVRRGELPAFVDGRLVRIRVADLQRYVAERVARRTQAEAPTAAGRTLAAGERLWA